MTLAPALRQRISSILATYLEDGDPETDPAAEPVAIQAGSAVMFVRLVDSDPPLVRVFSPLVRDVSPSSDLYEELNEINSQLSFVRVFWRDDTVFAATELPASLLDEPELAQACEAVSGVADYYDSRLRDRFGGTLGSDATIS